MTNGYLAFLGLFILGLIIRFIYEQLKKDGRINPESRIIFSIIFLDMCVLWASWFNLCPLDPFRLQFSSSVKWAGFVIFLAGMVLAIVAFAQLRGVENINHLVTKGLFSKIRHPMYVGFILWIVGWAIFHGAVLSLLVGCLAIGNIFYWRKLEERELESHYGDLYLNYRKSTWF